MTTLLQQLETFMADPNCDQQVFTAVDNTPLDEIKVFYDYLNALVEKKHVRKWAMADLSSVTVDKTERGKEIHSLGRAKSTAPLSALQASDDRSRAVQKTPWRVSLDMMKQRVASVEYIHPESIPHMTIAIILLDNGYALQGMSAPADPANFNEKLGREYAYEDALKKLWALEAYVMRDFLSGNVKIDDAEKRWNPPAKT